MPIPTTTSPSDHFLFLSEMSKARSPVQVVEVGEDAAFGRGTVGRIGDVLDGTAERLEGLRRGLGREQQAAVEAPQDAHHVQAQVGDVDARQRRAARRQRRLDFGQLLQQL